MKENDPYEELLEKRIGDELKKLPDLPAPDTLIPRILAAVEEESRIPWWRQPWPEWPPRAQRFSLALLAAAAALIAIGLPGWIGSGGFGALPQQLEPVFAAIDAGVGVLTTMTRLAAVVIESFRAWLVAAFALISLMYLACLGIGTVCFRTALHRCHTTRTL